MEPGVERSGTQGTSSIYRASPRMRATAIGSISMMTKWRITKSCRPLRGLDVRLRHVPGVPLTLHPRLHADARIRGLSTRQNVGNDKALCCRPRSRAALLHYLFKDHNSLLRGALLAAPAQPAAEFRPWQGVDDRAGLDPSAPRLKDSVAGLFELCGAVGVGINRERLGDPFTSSATPALAAASTTRSKSNSTGSRLPRSRVVGWPMMCT